MTKASPSKWLVRITMWSVALLAISACVYAAFMVIYVSAGSIRTEPNPGLQSTTAYVYEHPQQSPSGLEILPQPTLDGDTLCYMKNDLQQGREAFFEDNRWTELFLNGQRVPPSAIVDMAWTPSFSYSCLKSGPLSPGLHLFELYSRKNLWDRPVVYQWAVMVEK